MKLKTRLIVAFIIITLVPLLLESMVILLWGNYQLKSIARSYQVDNANYESISNPIYLLNKLTKKIHNDIKEVIGNEPEDLDDTDYLDSINEKLEEKYSFLIVRKNEELVYIGTNSDISDLVSKLPDYGEYVSGLDVGYYIGGDDQYLVKQEDFIFTDDSPGSVFIVTGVGAIIPEVKSMIKGILLATIVILFATSGLLTAWIYRGVSKPLRKLKKATQNIKEGNLDFHLEVLEADEIGELCVDFEDMRKRLKDSAEEKLQYDMENKELISNISHDLKTPITAIKGYVEGIMDGVADTPEKIDKYIKTIYNKANDMSRLIDELTFYSKIDTNKIPYSFHKINVDQYFRDCVEEIGLDLDAKNIKLAYFNYADESIQVIADPEQIKRVINNIISNSVKYIGKKQGIVNIRIRDVGDFIQVEIEDNGKGIAPKDLPYIFDRFYRTDASRNSSQGGSGIGLSIVKKIIDDHNGKIWATSKEDTGTIMHFVLRKYYEETVGAKADKKGESNE